MFINGFCMICVVEMANGKLSRRDLLKKTTGLAATASLVPVVDAKPEVEVDLTRATTNCMNRTDEHCSYRSSGEKEDCTYCGHFDPKGGHGEAARARVLELYREKWSPVAGELRAAS